MPEVVAAVEQAHREEWGRVLATVARLLDGDLATAEECTQEAFEQALRTWGERGIPRSPGAWLTTTARRRALDRVRREAALRTRLPDLVVDEVDDPEEEAAVDVDDRLRLVFTCCHPALAPESRTALTLRLVCGLTTDEIARAFLVPEPTMAARITRAKKKVTAAGIPYRVPSDDELPERLDGVLTVIHLAFTAGHTSPGPELVRADLVARALDLARVLAVLMPDEPEALGLLALLELTDARRAARVDEHGGLVLLEDQDRSLWDREALDRGDALVVRALRLTRPERPPGRFLLQACIAGAHSEAPSWEATDWRATVLLYDRLREVWPSPVVDVNRAVAVAFAEGPEQGLAELDAVADDPALRSWHYLPAARADLLRRLGRREEAAAAYRAALGLVSDGAERAFLRRRLGEVETP
ncbi:MAG TPA: sigma-70 family RNA polymerase sigma factor [Candidatus Nanopelagicales bacterium]|nr:sigma-70 family RNA polymerase sigma factor [Candidatus Nanopelagicales bacterium]